MKTRNGDTRILAAPVYASRMGCYSLAVPGTGTSLSGWEVHFLWRALQGPNQVQTSRRILRGLLYPWQQLQIKFYDVWRARAKAFSKDDRQPANRIIRATVATLATHDLPKVHGNLTWTCQANVSVKWIESLIRAYGPDTR